MRVPVFALGVLAALSLTGRVGAGIVVYDNGAANDLSTTVTDDVLVQDGPPPGGTNPTTLNILTGGRAANQLTVNGQSQVNLLGGTVQNLSSYGFSSVSVTPAPLSTPHFVVAQLATHDSSTVIISPHGEGSTRPLYLGNIALFDSSTVISNGAESASVTTHGDSHLTVNVLNIHGRLNAYENSVVDFNGGGFSGLGYISTNGQSTVTMRGSYGMNGGYVVTNDSSRFILVGAFNYSGGPISDRSGTISGTLADGGLVFARFNRNGDSEIIIVAAPAPSGVALGIAGLLCLGGYSWRRKRAVA